MWKQLKQGVICALAGLLLACGGGSGGGGSVDRSSPEGAVNATVSALRNNNTLGVLESVFPPAAIDEMRSSFASEIASMPVGEAERAEFAATMGRLTAPGAEDALMAELEPQLAQMAAQMPMMMGFAQMMASQAVSENPDLSDDQKEQAQQSVQAAMSALQDVDISDTGLAREAIGVVCATARDLNLNSLDQVKSLSFDQALGKGDIVLRGLKELLAVYSLSIDDTLDSVRTEVVSQDGDNATVQLSYELFGAPQSSKTEMVLVDGRWYDKELTKAM